MHNITVSLITTLLVGSFFSGCGDSVAETNQAKAALGAELFNNKNLSANRSMSCATCHDLSHGMIDARNGSEIGASLGDDGSSVGDRNAPTASYAAHAPRFHFDSAEGLYIGGQFLDGRAADLKAQAKGPFLNPVEMNMADESAVIERIEENATLVSQLKAIYGDDILSDDLKAYDAVAESIAMFEMTPTFSPFDAKFDRVYEGSASFTALEAEGKKLFEGKALCVACHPIEGHHPLMTDYSYDNLGVPMNTALRALNGVATIDNGLGKEVAEAKLNGAYKVSTLRNIAVTAPYMHNGLFKDLKTVVHFYNTRDVVGATNPETGLAWKDAEVPDTVNHKELGNLGLSDHEEDAIVAFMKTFTDQKFEHLNP